ncbi:MULTISPECIES: ABC transporter ATP-binding protein [Paenibacillus]|uniref:Export ABC transporter ATP-binding protein n=1 Tax=Paenibacillus campinasensis TaxID=66347 RepID=A0A268EQ77_9BACL|nr:MULTISPECIES: ABC transporter ATP-binding protein [Paenibacillus]PAD75284.1 export ABC transporter ATP-binding protein [Paenibacillus campinasensis]PAK55817.1 export ABC transporter ATP-binding protein [Paenibacillus sp. 7541]
MAVAAMSDIVKRYGDHRVLDHVDMEIGEGEIVGLLGPNGAGKTTLIHALCGLIRVDSGTIKLFGEHLSGTMLDIKRKIGLVTQEITVFEDLTARENLAFFGGIYGLKGAELKRRIAETLEFVGLEKQANKSPKKFSGGMKRRLNIACSIIHDPKLLIMDEPTVGIDPQSRNHILESVQTLQSRGTTILYTTHYMEEVQAIASRVLIMDQGHVIAQGSIEELVRNLHHEEKIKLEVMEVTDDLIRAIEQLGGVKRVNRSGSKLQIISQAGAGNLDRILSLAKRAGGVISIHADQPSLEDVFLTLTGKQLRDTKED